jgi:hypothetical protein
MVKYIKGKDGKMAGSIGDGKRNLPTASRAHPTLAATPAADVRTNTEVDKFLLNLERVRGPQDRRTHERFFAAKLSRIETVSPVDASFLQAAYRRAEQAATFTDEMTAQQSITDGVTSILFPGASTIEFTRSPDGDSTTITRITSAAGATIYEPSTSTDPRRAHAIQAILDGFHSEVLPDYFVRSAVSRFTRKIGG